MRYFPILISVCCFSAVPAHAQVAQTARSDDRITVLANGQPDRLDQTGQAISILTDDDLRAVQGPDIARALQRLPGVSLTRNGGLGSFAGLSVRGSASERVLVLIDGVRVNDVSSPAGGFDFGTVMAGSIGRVELLRGSNSIVWGSDAMGGVIHLTTRQVDGVLASVEYGGDAQFTGNLALGHAGEGLNATIGANFVTADGFSTAAIGSENDGFEQLSLSAGGDVLLADNFTVLANARYVAGEVGIDGFPAPDYTFADTAERQDTRQFSGRAGFAYAGDFAQISGGVAFAETERDLVDEDAGEQPYYSTQGRSTRAELLARFALTDALKLDTGADWEWTRFTDGFAIARADIASAHGLLGWYGQAVSLAVGLRRDEHDRFGGAWSLGANGSLQMTDELRLRASYGEGFKSPSLFQLYSDFGNQALKAERSQSYDLGADFATADRSLTASLTIFRRDSTDLIDFVSCFGRDAAICIDRPFGTYDNVSRARSQGVELEAGFAIAEEVRTSAAYAWTKSTNRISGNDLARRPRHAGTVTLDWDALAGLTLGADLRVVSSSFDDAGNFVRLGGYEVFDLRGSLDVSEALTLFGRIENLWGEIYQTAAGYGTQGRAAFIGARAAF